MDFLFDDATPAQIASGAITLALCLASCGVWFHRLRTRDLVPLDDRIPTEGWPVDVAAVVITLGWIGLGFLTRLTADPPAGNGDVLTSIQMAAATNGFLIAIVLAMQTRLFRDDPRKIGMDFRSGDAGWGLAGLFLAWLPVMLLLLAIQELGMRTEDNLHPFLKKLGEDGSAEVVLWVVVSAVITAPLAEELMFRVVLQGALQKLVSGPVAVGISSVVFCAVHGWPDMLALLPLAVVLGTLYLRRGSYWSVVITHAAFNALMILIAALGAE